MKRRDALFYGSLVFLGTLAYSAFVLPQMPAMSPVHWGLDGRPDQWAPKSVAVAFAPCFQMVGLGFLWWLPRLAPTARSTRAAERATGQMVLGLIGFFAYIQVVTTLASIGPVDVGRWILGGVFGLLFVLGGSFEGLERNPWIGYRTPLTLSSDEVWRRTHNFARRVVVFGSVVGLLLVLINVPDLVALGWLLATMLLPLFYSMTLRRRS